jgi:hypothetical protein
MASSIMVAKLAICFALDATPTVTEHINDRVIEGQSNFHITAAVKSKLLPSLRIQVAGTTSLEALMILIPIQNLNTGVTPK